MKSKGKYTHFIEARRDDVGSTNDTVALFNSVATGLMVYDSNIIDAKVI